MKAKFYRCPICGNVIVKLVDSKIVPVCCGQTMERLDPADSEGKEEYHQPVVEAMGGCAYRVSVGHDPHPMTKEHHIAFIAAETWRGGVVRIISTDSPASTTFYLDDTPCAFYAYCNLHGLWMTPVIEYLEQCKKHQAEE